MNGGTLLFSPDSPSSGLFCVNNITFHTMDKTIHKLIAEKHGFYMFGGKGDVWSQTAHLSQSGKSTTLCGKPMLSTNWVRINNLNFVGCKDCEKLYYEFGFAFEPAPESNEPPPTFTVEQGLEYQRQYLLQWKSILKPGLYKMLANYIALQNLKTTMKSGYDVVRGTEIDNWVHNNLMSRRDYETN